MTANETWSKQTLPKGTMSWDRQIPSPPSLVIFHPSILFPWGRSLVWSVTNPHRPLALHTHRGRERGSKRDTTLWINHPYNLTHADLMVSWHVILNVLTVLLRCTEVGLYQRISMHSTLDGKSHPQILLQSCLCPVRPTIFSPTKQNISRFFTVVKRVPKLRAARPKPSHPVLNIFRPADFWRREA